MTSENENTLDDSFRSPWIRFFYIASPAGDLRQSPVKIGITRDERTLRKRLATHKKNIDPDLEFAAVFEWKDGRLYPEEDRWPVIDHHTPEDIEIKIKAQLNRDFLNSNGLFRGELFNVTAEHVITMMTAIDQARSSCLESQDILNTYSLARGVSVSIRQIDGQWQSLGLYLCHDPAVDISTTANDLSTRYAGGESIQIINLFSPNPSFIVIPPNHGILMFSAISEAIMSISDLKVACLAHLNDMEIALTDYEYQSWQRYKSKQLALRMQTPMYEKDRGGVSDGDVIAL